MRPARLILFAAAIASLALMAGLVTPFRSQPARTPTCPKGYTLLADLEAHERALEPNEAGEAREGEGDIAHTLCVNDKHPEAPADLMQLWGQEASARLAPYGSAAPNALSAALSQANKLPTKPGRWVPLGSGPLHSDDPDYNQTNVLGLVELAGRITDFEYVAKTDQLFAAVGYGGVWRSDDHGTTWESVGEGLPKQVVGSVRYTSAKGGSLLALTGDNSFGRDSLEGVGAWWSSNGGKTWNRAKGVPDGAFGFKLAVDRASPSVVYAATGAGLFRSTDAGRSYVNVKLPTGDCAGQSNHVRPCLFANIVSDVVVQEPGGKGDAQGHRVVAAVGWRAGNKENPDGTVQSPNNGLYASDTGEPGSFQKLQALGFAQQDRIGRIELGSAIGPDQDHNYLYALVEDAFYFTENLPTAGIDAPEAVAPFIPTDYPTNMNGVYVSADFGETWTLMMDGLESQEPTTGSALVVTTQALGGFGPGIQAWYNMFITPDPTRQDPVLGAPTRLTFGLEEVWQNEVTVLPQIGKSQFKVIGRYFSGDSCLFLVLGLPACPTDREDALVNNTTTHPDQHAAVYIPERDGGVTLVVGNDGGVYTQTVDSNGEFVNTGWGKGSNRGFNTLLPYHASIANDGTVWMGLQDNGTAKIEPTSGRQITALGGDGVYTAVDPQDSDIAYGEQFDASMWATTDGGKNWNGMAPPITDTFRLVQFVMDPKKAAHLMTGGRQIVETISGPGTGTDGWIEVFELGTLEHRGEDGAEATPEDPANSMSAVDLVGANAYVGFCGPCDVLDSPVPFHNGLATNVGGSKPPKTGTSQGWHFVKAKGLPNRVITSLAIDRSNPRIVYASLAGYARPWTPPGTLTDPLNAGRGHVFKSTNGGESFRNISANLPNSPAWWVESEGGHLVVATDAGVFVRSGSSWKRLGTNLPNAYVRSLVFKPDDANLLVAANYGRGVWAYRFGPPKSLGHFPKQKKVRAAPSAGAQVAGPFTFDTSEEGWTASTTNEAMTWRRQPPGDGSPFGFAVIPYVDQSSTQLLSPKFDLPKLNSAKYEAHTVTVSFSLLQNLEDGFDYLSIEWSSDGKKWNLADAFTGMNADFPTYTPTEVTFAAPPGGLYVRFRVASDQLVSFPAYQGSAIDNVSIAR